MKNDGFIRLLIALIIDLVVGIAFMTMGHTYGIPSVAFVPIGILLGGFMGWYAAKTRV